MFSDTFLTPSEERLANILWREAPITSPELVEFALRELNWKKSTTYTVLRKLCEKGVFININATVSVALTREELISRQSRSYVEDTFGGSLPRFIASFFGGNKLSEKQAEELIRQIEEHKGGDGNG